MHTSIWRLAGSLVLGITLAACSDNNNNDKKETAPEPVPGGS
jgi:hypothetical protein